MGVMKAARGGIKALPVTLVITFPSAAAVSISLGKCRGRWQEVRKSNHRRLSADLEEATPLLGSLAESCQSSRVLFISSVP